MRFESYKSASVTILDNINRPVVREEEVRLRGKIECRVMLKLEELKLSLVVDAPLLCLRVREFFKVSYIK